jgi:peptidoglycan/xylan/chitin deacetylase (PgdA/CDA1 family)
MQQQPLPKPALAADALTPAKRLAYVLQHFQLAYPGGPEVAIGYAPTAGITIGDGTGGFFDGINPHPPAPCWRSWAGQQIPFFFDAAPEAPLLTLTPGKATIGPDIISAAFYLLSGWQEYFSDARDRHGRFPYDASVQKQHGFVAVPVVNHYFDVLKDAVEHVSGQKLQPRRWAGNAPFAAFITHDIDSLNGGWGTAVRRATQWGQFLGAGRALWGKATGRPAPWNNLEHVQAATARYGAPSTFFMLGSPQPASNGTANADYAINTALLGRLRRLEATGAETASHGSYGTATDAVRLQNEISQYGLHRPRGNRFHYLCWEPRRTPGVVAAAGFSYDSTLGFAEYFGFRNSYCLPFFPFDFARGQAQRFLEIPLNVMDVTLHHPNYLQLRPADILPALRPMLQEIERFGGVATVLWHNDHFDPANETTGPQQFAEIMSYLQQRSACFLTGSQIVAELCGL